MVRKLYTDISQGDAAVDAANIGLNLQVRTYFSCKTSTEDHRNKALHFPISSPKAPERHRIEGKALHFDSSKNGGDNPLHIRWLIEEELEILALSQEHGDEGCGPEADEDPFHDCAGEVEDESSGAGAGFLGVVAEEGGQAGEEGEDCC